MDEMKKREEPNPEPDKKAVEGEKHIAVDKAGKFWFFDPFEDEYGPWASKDDAKEALCLYADVELEGKPNTDEMKARWAELKARGAA